MITKNYLLTFDIFNDNEFLDLYVNLINNNENTVRSINKTNLHHIIPRYYYLDRQLDINNDESNLVNLLYKDHILAHYYLARCSKNSEDISKNSLSIRFLLNGRSINDFNIDSIDLDYYQYMYELSKDRIFNITHTYEVNKKISQKLIGRTSPNKNNKKHVNDYKVSRKNPNAKNKLLSDYASQRTGSKNPFYGRTHSEDAKMAIALKNGKPVLMMDLVTNEIIAKFDTITDAARYLVKNSIAISVSAAVHSISCVCRGKAYRAYGYFWQFTNKV